jgi:hypothetical protein
MNKVHAFIRPLSSVALSFIIIVVAAAPAWGQTRAFMARQGVDPSTVPAAGATTINATAGEQLTVIVWFQDAAGLDELNSYVLVVPWDATGGGSGSVAYVDIDPGMLGGNTVLVDKTHPEWVFSEEPGASDQFVAYTEVSGVEFGAFYSYLPGSGVEVGPGSNVPNPGGPNYVMQFDLQVSADACGTFDLPFGAASGFFNVSVMPYGGAGAVTFQAAQVVLGPCKGCDNSEDCNDGNPCTDDLCQDQSCMTQPNVLPCDDGDSCTTDDFCAASQCMAGTPIDCDDSNDCTIDSCAAGSGCQHDSVFGQPCKFDVDCQVAGSSRATCEGGFCVCGACGTGSDCADLNEDGIRDDACAWYGCTGEACVTVPKTTQADIGGFNGACPIDTACDGNDRFHALNCFSDSSTQGTPPYPCEPASPFALNVDAGGPATCQLDGVCDGNDAFHALNCFENDWFDGSIGYQCGCGAPQPVHESEAPPRSQQAGLILRAPAAVRPGTMVDVDVFLADDVAALRGYQLHLGTSGGKGGRLELVDIAIREPSAFSTPNAGAGLKPMRAGSRPKRAGLKPAPTNLAGAWSAFNTSTQQMLAGLDNPEGVPAAAGAYLATFTYRVPENAAGTFTIEVLYSDGGGPTAQVGTRAVPQDRTFLFGRYGGLIDVTEAAPVSVTVTPASRSRTARAARP